MKKKPVVGYTLFVFAVQIFVLIISLIKPVDNYFLLFSPIILGTGIPSVIAYVLVVIGEIRK